MMQVFGRTDEECLIALPLLNGEPDEEHARRCFAFGPGPLPLVPLVVQDEPPHDEATQRLEESHAWYADRVERGWTVIDLTPEEIAAKARKVWGNRSMFWAVFSNEEKLAILQSTAPAIILLHGELQMWTGQVWSDDARVVAGLDALEAAGIISVERRTQILA